jgi:hypothetical protein
MHQNKFGGTFTVLQQCPQSMILCYRSYLHLDQGFSNCCVAGFHLRAVREGARGPPEGDDSLLPPQPLRSCQALCLLVTIPLFIMKLCSVHADQQLYYDCYLLTKFLTKFCYYSLFVLVWSSIFGVGNIFSHVWTVLW